MIAAGESEAVWFEDIAGVASDAAEPPVVYLLRTGADLVVEVAYRDVADRQEAASSLYLSKSGTTDRTYRVTRVDPGHPPRLTLDQIGETVQIVLVPSPPGTATDAWGAQGPRRRTTDPREWKPRSNGALEWTMLGSNQRPPPCRGGALPAELIVRER